MQHVLLGRWLQHTGSDRLLTWGSANAAGEKTKGPPGTWILDPFSGQGKKGEKKKGEIKEKQPGLYLLISMPCQSNW